MNFVVHSRKSNLARQNKSPSFCSGPPLRLAPLASASARNKTDPNCFRINLQKEVYTNLQSMKRLVSLPMLVACSALCCIAPDYVGYQWDMSVEMNVYIDPSFDNLPNGPGNAPSAQIAAAITIWNNYFASVGSSFRLNPVSSPTQANLTIGTAYQGANVSAGASQPRMSGPISSTQITVFTNPQFQTGGSIIDPTQAGYQTYFTKVIEHELGHVFGLADVGGACSNVYQSIMDQMCGVDDSLQGIPLGLTPCDNQQEQIFEPPPASADPCAHVSCACAGGGTVCCKNPACCLAAVPVPGPEFGASTFSNGSPAFSVGLPVGIVVAPNERCTPILIDVSGKGYKLTDVDDGVEFDMFASGRKTRVPWPAQDAGNAWLAIDRNGNGTIDDASELFGNMSPQPKSDHPNGYTALAQYDRPASGGNLDGQIDSRDKVWSSLLLWIDKNHNGISEPSELFTLDVFGIEAISLSYQESSTQDANGNIYGYRAGLTVRPGSKAALAAFDVLVVNTLKK